MDYEYNEFQCECKHITFTGNIESFKLINLNDCIKKNEALHPAIYNYQINENVDLCQSG